MTQKPPNDWDPLDAAVLKDQRLAYDKMRERCPVAYSDFLGWSLFRHEDIAAVLADPATFINTSKFPAIPNGLNPPEHGAINAALAAFFTDENMAKLEPGARELAIELMTPLCPGSDVEFIDTFITPFVLRTLCALLGWPAQQCEHLAEWEQGNQQVAFTLDPVAGKELADFFAAKVKANLDLHRDTCHTAANATHGLLLTEIDGKRFSDEDIISILRNWVAGHGTTVDALGIVVMHLAQDHALQERLRQSPALIPAAIEEILRVDGPLVANRRTTTRAVDVHGLTIPKNSTLSLMWIAANRDPFAFRDPDVVNLERNNAAAMVWGQGIHLCIGAPLARLEMRIALEELLARTSRITLVGAKPVRNVFPGNGLATLRLCLE